MTRATLKAVRRVVLSEDRFGATEFVAEVTARTLVLRPIKSRAKGPQAVTLTWGAIYLRGMSAKAEEEIRARRRVRDAKRRGSK